MAERREIDPIESPLDPDATQMQPPLSGTVDDSDDVDDERWDENEPPDRALSAESETPDSAFRLDKQEEDTNEDLAADDEESVD